MAVKERTMADRSASLSENFRKVAGLPDRKNDKPQDVGDVKEARLATEPEGGYGGKDGIANTGAINATEANARKERDEREEKAAKDDDKPAKKTAAKKSTAKKKGK